MFGAAVEVGISTFMTLDAARVRGALQTAGIEPWLTQRLTVFIPAAFGRRLLANRIASMGNMLTDPRGSRPLDSDPVWTALEARTKRATRAEMNRIAPQSSIVASVSALIAGGSALEKLVIGGVTLTEPLLPLGKGHGGVPSPRAAFLDFVRGHGIAVDREGLANGVRLDARVFPSQAQSGVGAQVDFVISDPRLAAGILLESFASYGHSWQIALGQTIQKFERGDLHVLVEGLLHRGMCPEQVSWEKLSHPNGDFDVCLGPQLVLYTQAPAPPIANLVDALYRALHKVSLSRAIHALRLFVWLQDGALQTVEVLLDNETWPAGEELAGRAPWPSVPGPLATRVFALLVPAPPAD